MLLYVAIGDCIICISLNIGLYNSCEAYSPEFGHKLEMIPWKWLYHERVNQPADEFIILQNDIGMLYKQKHWGELWSD